MRASGTPSAVMIAVTMKRPCMASTNASVWVYWLTMYMPPIWPASPEPSAFVRYAIYAGLALVEVFALFTYSLKVETRIRNRAYAPEWR